MKHDLTWFEERIGREIVRFNSYNNTKATITISDDGIDYRRHLLYQDCGYTFSDPLRIHRKPFEECEACSA